MSVNAGLKALAPPVKFGNSHTVWRLETGSRKAPAKKSGSVGFGVLARNAVQPGASKDTVLLTVDGTGIFEFHIRDSQMIQSWSCGVDRSFLLGAVASWKTNCIHTVSNTGHLLSWPMASTNWENEFVAVKLASKELISLIPTGHTVADVVIVSSDGSLYLNQNEGFEEDGNNKTPSKKSTKKKASTGKGITEVRLPKLVEKRNLRVQAVVKRGSESSKSDATSLQLAFFVTTENEKDGLLVLVDLNLETRSLAQVTDAETRIESVMLPAGQSEATIATAAFNSNASVLSVGFDNGTVAFYDLTEKEGELKPVAISRVAERSGSEAVLPSSKRRRTTSSASTGSVPGHNSDDAEMYLEHLVSDYFLSLFDGELKAWDCRRGLCQSGEHTLLQESSATKDEMKRFRNSLVRAVLVRSDHLIVATDGVVIAQPVSAEPLGDLAFLGGALRGRSTKAPFEVLSVPVATEKDEAQRFEKLMKIESEQLPTVLKTIRDNKSGADKNLTKFLKALADVDTPELIASVQHRQKLEAYLTDLKGRLAEETDSSKRHRLLRKRGKTIRKLGATKDRIRSKRRLAISMQTLNQILESLLASKNSLALVPVTLLLRTDRVSANVHPQLLERIFKEQNFFLLEQYILHVHDITPAQVLEIIQFAVSLQGTKGMEKYARSGRKSDIKATKDSRLKKPERDADLLILPEADGSDIFLQLVTSCSHSPHAMQDVVTALNNTNAIAMLSFCARWLQAYVDPDSVEGDDNETKKVDAIKASDFVTRVPVLSQVLFWTNVVLDAKMSVIISDTSLGQVLRAMRNHINAYMPSSTDFGVVVGHLADLESAATLHQRHLRRRKGKRGGSGNDLRLTGGIVGTVKVGEYTVERLVLPF
eukprot:Clim_evm3s168 gene=Clim_evmTU3s168